MPPRPGLAIGLVYETHDTYTRGDGEPSDWNAEYEPIETIEALEAALRRLGHRPVRVGSPHELLRALGGDSAPALDAALSIAEGHGSRNREGWAPALLEMAGVPALGSDALTLSLTLDKAWTNRFLSAAGVAVPPHCVMGEARDAREGALPADFPLFVKPRWEGTAKGIRSSSRVEDRAALAREVERVVSRYRQPALVEAFVPGPEYTATVVGNGPPRALPVVQRALDRETGIGFHALDAGQGESPVADVPGLLTPEVEAAVQRAAIQAYVALECLDYARADFRLDAAGTPVFLEINPLPTFAPDGTFGILAELAGRSLDDLLAEVLAAGLERLGLTPREGARHGEAP